MKVELTAGRVGVGCSFQSGQIVDFPDDEARRMIAEGSAREIFDIEIATAEPKRERAVRRRRQRNTVA